MQKINYTKHPHLLLESVKYSIMQSPIHEIVCGVICYWSRLTQEGNGAVCRVMSNREAIINPGRTYNVEAGTVAITFTLEGATGTDRTAIQIIDPDMVDYYYGLYLPEKIVRIRLLSDDGLTWRHEFYTLP